MHQGKGVFSEWVGLGQSFCPDTLSLGTVRAPRGVIFDMLVSVS